MINTKKKFLIVGGESRLARCFRNLYSRESVSLKKQECDITSEESIQKAFKKHKFNFVLNCAAVTDIEKCEKNLKLCFDVNVVGVFLLNKICLQNKKKLIHISSNYAVNPVNNYGWSKHLSEKVIDKKNFLLIRTSFFDENTFIIKNLMSGNEVNVFKNLFFNPVSVNTLAQKIYEDSNKKGILNIFTSKKINYLKFARLFCEEFGLNEKLIKQANFKKTIYAERPRNSYIETDIKIDIKKDLAGFKKYYLANER